MLPICRAYGETRVLLTCDPQNTASQKTILRCGGNLENEVEDSAGLGASGVIARYWIPLEDLDKQDIAMLTSKDTDSACAFAGKIIDESKESGMWYGCFDAFAALLDHSNSFVRNRAIRILEALAPWDAEDRFEAILPHFLSHITDEKPITARQCVQSLAQVGQAKPRLIGAIVSALHSADVSHYRDSMRPLVEKDIAQTLKRLAETDEDRRIVKADGSFGKP